MPKQTKEQYLESLNFGLPNLDKTSAKYQNYKPKEFQEFLKKNKSSIDLWLSVLKDRVMEELYGYDRAFFKSTLIKRGQIRRIATCTNAKTYNINYNKIRELLGKSNPNTIKSFTIKFYLAYYEQINEAMKDALIEYVRDNSCMDCFGSYCHKCMVEKVIEEI